MGKSSLIEQFVAVLGPDRVLFGDALQGRYAHIWQMETPLQALCVILPRSTEEVSQCCAICYAGGQPMVVHGGLTGLVGSTVSRPSDVVISLERMDVIEEIDPYSKTMQVQSGTILDVIREAAQKEGLFFPLSFGARGSARIGGCIATNAGGVNVIKYGMTRNLVLGLEVVLPDGRIIDTMKKLIKDNTGYALSQLFVGSEGTLGIITRAMLKLSPLPQSRQAAWIGLTSFDGALQWLRQSEAALGSKLASFELLWQDTYEAQTSERSPYRAPLPHGYPFYVLMETHGQDAVADYRELSNLLESGMESGAFEDAVLAHSAVDLEWFWNIREDVTVMTGATDFTQSFDISLPLQEIGDYVALVKPLLEALPEVVNAYAFGHLGDGNLHFLVNKQMAGNALKMEIDRIVYAPLSELKGSVSAEHGIGLDKKQWLPLSRSAEELALMRRIKEIFDPEGLLNPGRILDIVDKNT